MALTLKWDKTATVWTAPAKAKFTVEVRPGKSEQPPNTTKIVVSTYAGQVEPGPGNTTHKAVAEGKTLIVSYETAMLDGARVELWEVDAEGEAQRLTWRKHKPAAAYIDVQIN